MKKILKYGSRRIREKMHEALISVFPITLIVLLLSISIAPISSGSMMAFLVGAVLLTIGMGLFSLGAEMAMTPMGEHLGAHITKTRKIFLIIGLCFLLGLIITIAEPDLQVLATQVADVPNAILIGAVGVGVGIFLVIAMLRIFFRVKLSYLLIGAYAVVFLISAFVPENFLSIAFDSGGVTTGPMTVPFIMALGVGVASIRSDSNANEDSFGLVAVCSVGPILAVLILGLLYKPSGGYSPVVVPDVGDTRELWQLFMSNFPHYAREVGIALGPIVIFFVIYQFVALKLPRSQILRIAVGVGYTYLGLLLFLTGVNVGFMPVGNMLGSTLASLHYRWILVPIGMVIGYFIVAAEPAVHVLNRQVEEITDGAIPPKALSTSLSIGVAISVGLAMIRVLTGISIFYLVIPGYAIAILLTFFCPPIFTAIAFDSGGVASGPMTATFLIPLAMGACTAVGGNIITDAFGIVAMVAMTPLITIQCLGVYYRYKQRHAASGAEADAMEETSEEDIIELGKEISE